MRNTIERAGLAMSSLAVVGAIGYKTPAWLEEQSALNQLQTMDFAEAHMVKQGARLVAQLEKQKPEQAKAIAAQCSVALNNCLDAVQFKGNDCSQIAVGAKVFHETVAKPRESHLINPQPEVYKCDLPIQAAMNQCHEEALYCLEKPMR